MYFSFAENLRHLKLKDINRYENSPTFDISQPIQTLEFIDITYNFNAEGPNVMDSHQIQYILMSPNLRSITMENVSNVTVDMFHRANQSHGFHKLSNLVLRFCDPIYLDVSFLLVLLEDIVLTTLIGMDKTNAILLPNSLLSANDTEILFNSL